MSDIKVGDYVKVEQEDPVGNKFTTEGIVRPSLSTMPSLHVGKTAVVTSTGDICGTILEHKPLRMDEPGYGEHVSAAADDSVTGLREEYVRLPHPMQDSGIGEWVCIKHGLRSRWDELIDPQPVSPI